MTALPFDPRHRLKREELKMFSYLVESDLHKGELKRRGTFFLATIAAYAVVLMALGVAGVYAYEARIEDQQTLELVALVPPETEEETKKDEAPPKVKPAAPTTPTNAGGPSTTGGLIKNTPSNVSTDLTKIAGAAQAATTQAPPILSDGTGIRTFDPGASNPFGGGRDGGGDPSGTNEKGGGGRVLKDEPPLAAKKQEPPEKKIKYIGPANSQAISLPEPVYPQIARVSGVQGTVTVEILIDETGRVMTARATSGHPFLKPEAERAAARARFTPTTLGNQPVKAKGIITFNFILRK